MVYSVNNFYHDSKRFYIVVLSVALGEKYLLTGLDIISRFLFFHIKMNEEATDVKICVQFQLP